MAKPFTPHDYQQRGIELLVANDGAGLLLDPGMGKTATALAAFEVLRSQGVAEKMLVIAPLKPAYDTWQREPQKWADFSHLRTVVLHGEDKADKLYDQNYDIYIINPEGLKWLRHYLRMCNMFDVLCVDESTKFKNSTAKRFAVIRELVMYCRRRWILTGTVVPNGLHDLFGQVFIMDCGETLGSYVTHYRNRYFFKDGYKYIARENAMEEVTKLIAPMVLKLDAEDYLKMPECQYHVKTVVLPPDVMDHYKRVERDFITMLKEGMVVAANAAAAGTKCRQICNGSVYLEDDPENTGPRPWEAVHDLKLQALEELVEETNGQPLLVMYEFKHDLLRIQKEYPKSVCITGQKGRKLEGIVDAFNNGQIDMLTAHAGSLHGMNIQGACRHLVWYGTTWNLEDYIQANWRLYRQGQQLDLPVMIYHILAEGTLDLTVAEVLMAKEATQEQVENLLIQHHQL